MPTVDGGLEAQQLVREQAAPTEEEDESQAGDERRRHEEHQRYHLEDPPGRQTRARDGEGVQGTERQRRGRGQPHEQQGVEAGVAPAARRGDARPVRRAGS